MQIRTEQIAPGGAPCGCGRSPTGKCCGWHALTEEAYQAKMAEYELAKYRESAEELWFEGGSCTGGKAE